jgi:hypothetical protein
MSKSLVARVGFSDSSVKAFALTSTTTAEEFRQSIVKRLDLTAGDTFAVFEKRDDFERCLDKDEKPADLMKEWEQDKKSKVPPCFVFKKKIFLKDDEREMQDPIAKDLVYIQAVHDVITSVYNVTQEEALKLAGLQVQVVYGDHNPATHVVGFLTNNKDIQNFVPVELFPQRKPAAWEEAILKEHAKHRGVHPDEARTLYLNICKAFPLYGMTLFPPCKSSNNKNLPSRVIIGVNFEGVHLLKVRNKEPISDHLYTEICSWASSSTTFGFEFGNQSDSQKYTFETRVGTIIAATVQTYIDILVQMLKNGEDSGDEA